MLQRAVHVVEMLNEQYSVMPTTVVHCKKKPYDVYIGRASGARGKWGNPFSHLEGTLAEFKVADREEAVRRYEEWILTQQHLLDSLHELRGKVLGCWCKPLACHGDVLALMADSDLGLRLTLQAKQITQ